MPPAVALRAQIADIDAQIRDHETSISSLLSKREQLDSELKAIVYPIHTLPIELLVKIFQHACADQNIPHFRLTVAAVCRVWLDTALTTSSLWQRLVFRCKSASPEVQEILRTWLSRSKILPLDIIITLPLAVEDANIVMLLLAEFSSRWRFAGFHKERRLGGPRGPSIQVTSEAFPASLPLLETLEFYAQFELARNSREASSSWPALRKLVLWGCTPPVVVSFENLTRLEIGNLSVQKALIMLQQCPLLENLNLDSYHHDDDSETGVVPQIPLALTHLHTLELHIGEAHVLPALVLPALKSVILDVQPPEMGIPVLRSLFERSRCQVETVRIVSYTFAPSYEFLASQLFPAMHSLVISCFSGITSEDLLLLSGLGTRGSLACMNSLTITLLPSDVDSSSLFMFAKSHAQQLHDRSHSTGTLTNDQGNQGPFKLEIRTIKRTLMIPIKTAVELLRSAEWNDIIDVRFEEGTLLDSDNFEFL
ncbi:F-box domain-containing protein [Mycena indigotica]|uniref:F-box domain-containing protein n=1 Tax=Mycena indigotica TaxID=2126181 RepID=A0A8H6RZV2_9AGAR|nr:F-box domain-containing protein [Mycena indigotica]KAF7289733.1 F-box domain-containing protein [Mycena indigotica]